MSYLSDIQKLQQEMRLLKKAYCCLDTNQDGTVSLDELNNVTITNPTAGQVLKFNGFDWVNGTDEGEAFLIVNNYADLPSPATVSGEIYAVINSTGIKYITPLFGGNYYAKGFYYSDGAAWIYLGEFPIQATQSEVDAGTIQDKFVSPATLHGYTASVTVSSTPPPSPSLNDLWVQI